MATWKLSLIQDQGGRPAASGGRGEFPILLGSHRLGSRDDEELCEPIFAKVGQRLCKMHELTLRIPLVSSSQFRPMCTL
jgi:hypothetical protein